MTALLVPLIALGVLLASYGAWIILGRPEHICPGCDMPDSRCECEL